MEAVLWALVTIVITSLLLLAVVLIFFRSKELRQISTREKISKAIEKVVRLQEEIAVQQERLAVNLLRLEGHKTEEVGEPKDLHCKPRVPDGPRGQDRQPVEPEASALKETKQGQPPPPAFPLALEGMPEKCFQQPADPVFPDPTEPPCGKHSCPGDSPEPGPTCPWLSPLLLQRPWLFPSVSESMALGGSSGDGTASVTGVQRFQDALKTPYTLTLRNEPGRAELKHVVIDGSNVAMAHGLRKFFSCRGIALAVEYFWKLGNRNITVFVPQWRTRRDPHVTEQHLLGQLQELGIVALTPARRFCGVRISSHDDRFLLHLADKTGGIIVTNDNLREFVTESVSWRDTIATRLLQYTFAGDIFMVPDDPLGRHGPRLEEFLRKELFPGDRQPGLSGLPSRSTLDSGLWSPSTSHETPPRILQRASPSPGLSLQQCPPGLITLPRMCQDLPRQAQRSWAESSKPKEWSSTRIFPDSEPKRILTRSR